MGLDPLELVVRGEFRAGARRLSDDYLLATADEAHTVGQALDAEDLARLHHCPVVYDGMLPDCFEAVLLPDDQILTKRRRNLARVAVGILHELAHALLRRSGIAHEHGDVWILTFALAFPSGLWARICDGTLAGMWDLVWSTITPLWMADLRAEAFFTIRGLTG